MKKTGFTLIELLAVIVILAIIALIAVPIILGVIEKARIGSAESSALGYIDAVEKQVMINQVDSLKNNITDGVYDVPMTEVTIKGESPKKGWIVIEKGQVTNYSLVIGNYVITKGEKTVKGKEATPKPEEIEIILPRGLTKGTAVYINPETKSVCNEVDAVSTTGTKTGCMKWYVYKDNGNGTYQVMLDHNTTALVAWNSSGNNIDGMKEVADSLASDTISWNKSLNARLITADEIAEIVGANSEDMIKWNSSKSYGTTIDTQSAWFYFDGGRNSNPKVYESISDGWQKQYAKSIGMSNYAWLFDYTDNCTTLGCNIDDNSNSGYWTSTPVSGNAIDTWTVTRRGRLINNNVGNDYTLGVRPVITI